jgi:hypothetical protein
MIRGSEIVSFSLKRVHEGNPCTPPAQKSAVSYEKATTPHIPSPRFKMSPAPEKAPSFDLHPDQIMLGKEKLE